MKWWPLGLYRVVGESMVPAYRPGDVLLGYRWRRPRVGDVVVARLEMAVIKRVVRIGPDGYWLEGDNAAASTDSRSLGTVPAVEAVIIAKIASGS